MVKLESSAVHLVKVYLTLNAVTHAPKASFHNRKAPCKNTVPLCMRLKFIRKRESILLTCSPVIVLFSVFV